MLSKRKKKNSVVQESMLYKEGHLPDLKIDKSDPKMQITATLKLSLYRTREDVAEYDRCRSRIKLSYR